MIVIKRCQNVLVFLFLFGTMFSELIGARKRTTCSKTQKCLKRKPIIVVIIADDLGWNDVGFHGSNQIPTPNIDAICYNGVIFQRHYVLPVCTPSRTAFLTGMYPIRTGMQGFPLRAGEPRGIPLNVSLLPLHMRRLGYATHLVGKWHVGYYTNRHTPTYRGFDTFYGGFSGYMQYFNHTITQNGHTGYDLHRNRFCQKSVDYSQKYLTDLLTDEADHIIANHDGKKPLYLQIAHNAPHASDAEDPMEVRDKQEMDKKFSYIKNLNRRKFASMVSTLDESVGRIITALNNNDMLKDSIILIVSDNGAQSEGGSHVNYGSNYPFRGQKESLFEGGIRGAACMYSPLIKVSSRVSEQLMHITDWLPTFYTAAGGNINDLNGLDGVDQWSSIKYNTPSKRQSVLFNIDEVEKSSSALIGRHKLVKGAALSFGYYGDSGISKTYPQYNASSVLSSNAGRAIASLSKTTLSEEKVLNLRQTSTVSCHRPRNYTMCRKECLFDVYADPCETQDLTAVYPDVACKLNRFIDSYKRVQMQETNKPVDPASFPELFNGTWMPWRIKP